MSGWSLATLTQNDVIAPGLHRLTMRVDDAVAKGFHAPGRRRQAVRTSST
jgi:hypothetical protein